MIKEYFLYLKDNPKGYWFKARLYGWGWVPVKWQGWAVVFVAILIGLVGNYIGEIDDSPGMMALATLLMIVMIFVFGFWKGEKPKWSWGLKK